MKSGKLLWGMYILMLVGNIVTSKFCNNKAIGAFFSIGFTAISAVICTRSIKDIVICYNERKYRKAFDWWMDQHVAFIPESREVVITIEGQFEKWQEDLISKLEKLASEDGYKVTVKSPLSEVIDQYYS